MEEHNGNKYIRYKNHEANAFEILFSGKNYKRMQLRQLRSAAEEAASLLDRKDLDVVTSHLQDSLRLRESYTQRFHHATERHRCGHDYFVEFIQHVIRVISPEATKEELVEEQESINMSANEADFTRFLEDIESYVAQAAALWPRVVKGEAYISTASTLTNTILCRIDCTVNAETILNPSWFKNGCLASGIIQDGSTCLNELQACASQIRSFYSTIILPMFQSNTTLDHAPLLIHMLLKANYALRQYEDLQDTVFNFPFVAVVASSLANRYNKLSPPIEAFRESVKTELDSLGEILRQHTGLFDTSELNHILSKIECLKNWTGACSDALSFGQLTSWIKVQLVHCNQIFTHESTLLQLFTYICERVRLKGQPLPHVLEQIFDDLRVSPFLFVNGRPKTLKDCAEAVQKWVDPQGISRNPKVTKRIFEHRSKQTLTEMIWNQKGRVTQKVTERLNGKSLENYLDWELKPPDMIGLEITLINAARRVLEISNTTCTADIFNRLRFKIFEDSELEKKLVEAFVKENSLGASY